MEFYDLDYFIDKASELYEGDNEVGGNKVTINYGNYDLTFYFNEDSRLVIKYKDIEIRSGLFRDLDNLNSIAKKLYNYQFHSKDFFETRLSKSIDMERAKKLREDITEQTVHISNLLDDLQGNVELYNSLYGDSELGQKLNLSSLDYYLKNILKYEKVVK